MNRALLGTTLMALAIAGAGVAHADRRGTSNRTLRGPYVFEIGGFDENDATAVPPHVGSVNALGVLKFDGAGGFSGTLTFTSSDNGGDQATCVEDITAGSYNISSGGPIGTGTLALSFPAHAISGPDSAGTLNFDLVVPSPDGKGARLLENDSSLTSVTVCGEPIATLNLRGGIRRAVPGND